MRPRGSFGCIAAALCAHAHEPIEVKALALRAQVGPAHARYTVSRLVDAGELVVVDVGRPMRVVRREAVLVHHDLAPLEAAMNAFWDFV